MAVEENPTEYRDLDNPRKQLGLKAVRKALTETQCQTAWLNSILKLRPFGKAERMEKKIKFTENRVKSSLSQFH